MSDILEVLLYPIKQIALLLFSLQFQGVSVGALMIAAVILGILFRMFIGSHMAEGLLSGMVRSSRSKSHSKEE